MCGDGRHTTPTAIKVYALSMAGGCGESVPKEASLMAVCSHRPAISFHMHGDAFLPRDGRDGRQRSVLEVADSGPTIRHGYRLHASK